MPDRARAVRPDAAWRRLALAAVALHPDEVARVVDDAPVADAVRFLGACPEGRTIDVLRHLTPDRASELLSAIPAETARSVLSAMPPRLAATLVSRLPAEAREARLGLLEAGRAAELRELAAYPADSAGGRMDPRVTAFSADATVRSVNLRLRAVRERRDQDLFLVDAEGRLAGTFSLQDAVLAPADTRLRDLVKAVTPGVQASTSLDQVIDEIERSRIASMPVVDLDGRLLGVLRQRELLEAAQEDAAADLLTMVGASKDERSLSSPFFAMRKRLPWLQVNLVTAFLASAVVGLFEDTIARFTALAVLMPVVAGQSGNTGAQALAVTMRGLFMHEILPRHWLRVALKEAQVGLLNGLAVAATSAGAVFAWSRSPGLALVIGSSMVLSMVAAGVAGATVPVALTRLRQDPAQSSSIVLTTITDVTGFFSFLGIATLLSRML